MYVITVTELRSGNVKNFVGYRGKLSCIVIVVQMYIFYIKWIIKTKVVSATVLSARVNQNCEWKEPIYGRRSWLKVANKRSCDIWDVQRQVGEFRCCSGVGTRCIQVHTTLVSLSHMLSLLLCVVCADYVVKYWYLLCATCMCHCDFTYLLEINRSETCHVLHCILKFRIFDVRTVVFMLVSHSASHWWQKL